MILSEDAIKDLKASLVAQQLADESHCELLLGTAVALCDLALKARTWQKIADQRAVEVADLKHELAKHLGAAE